MALNGKRKSNKCLYAEPMKMVVNVVKLSSSSISKMSLETFGFAPAIKSSFTVATTPALTQISRSQRALGPQDERNKYSFAANEKRYIDSKASDYIRKVREKNRQDVS